VSDVKKLTYILVAVLVSLLLVGGVVSAQETKMKTYKNEEYGLKVSYPKGWTKTEMDYKGSGILSLNAYPDPHNVSVTASELRKDLSLEEYTKAYDLKLDSLVRYQNVEKRKISISGVTAYVRVSTMARSGGGTRGKDIYLKQGDILYTLSFSTSVGSYKEVTEKYFDPVLDSFELI
jgi:hypothetical protein